jgi:hypothetical protein
MMDLADISGLLGIVLVAYGLSLVHESLPWIWCGCVCLLAVWLKRNKGRVA